MQHGDAFRERERALEDSFFHARNRELLSALKKQLEAEDAKEAIRGMCPIEDEAVLDKMAATGIGGESFAAMSLAPLVLVAWADGNVAPEERRAILDAAKAEGVHDVCLELLEKWLAEKPQPVLREAWVGYIRGLSERLSAAELRRLKSTVLGRAESVAKAAGGTLGLNRISTSEHAMLKELDAAFDT